MKNHNHARDRRLLKLINKINTHKHKDELIQLMEAQLMDDVYSI